jgi:hypothetical protein
MPCLLPNTTSVRYLSPMNTISCGSHLQQPAAKHTASSSAASQHTCHQQFALAPTSVQVNHGCCSCMPCAAMLWATTQHWHSTGHGASGACMSKQLCMRQPDTGFARFLACKLSAAASCRRICTAYLRPDYASSSITHLNCCCSSSQPPAGFLSLCRNTCT